ncbi:MAG: hypothetical protein RL336_2089 [Pseudomonadota bacterium]
MSTDRHFMARAIQLADRGRYSTSPNPRVGCVIVRNGEIVGEGWHQYAGEAHAEVNALAVAGQAAQGATAYVTLEPCSHTGKTGPCSQALVAAGVARVVSAMEDPNPQVSGRGHTLLRSAGIEVEVGVMAEQAAALNLGFIKRMRTGLPRVRCKLAMSLDGRTAMANGESQWITGSAARAEVHRLRASSCAVMTGIGSVLLDDSRLDVRELQVDEAFTSSRQAPLRVVMDSRLCTPLAARVIGDDQRCLILYSNSDVANAEELRQCGARVVRILGQSEAVDLESALRYLAEKEQCNEVLLEAGATLSGAMLTAGLVDELHLFVAPVLLGSDARPMVDMPLQHMADKWALTIVDRRQFGDDTRIIAIPQER